MNITELESYNLEDAVKFHDRLNPRLWGDDEHLRSDVRDKLLEIAEDFKEFLGIDDIQIKDITVSGSNAAYSYTPHSDIDLHLVADLPEADHNDVFRELFDAKKFQYNKEHDIRIGGYDVELYVQDPNQEHHSQGIYSLLQNKWISVPKRKKPDVDDISVKSKYEDVGHRIEDAVRSGSLEKMNDTWQKLKAMRKQGLEREGEFSPENLAFKILRNNGTIQSLVNARQAVKDRELSLAEAAKPKKKFRFGFSESPDGVNPTTKQILEADTDNVVMQFIKDTAQRLGIERMPNVHLHSDPEWSEREKSFGMFVPETWDLHVNTANRHLFDTLRTAAHELAHCRQHEIKELGPDAGDTGSPIENEAHAVAGIIMRDFADAHPDWFADQPIAENASGYIPTKKQAKDPRFSHALTVDIKPGQVGKEANKLNLQTDSQGHPALLIKNLRNQLREFKEGLDKPTLTPEQLAKKHNVNIKQIKQQLAKGMQVELEHTSSKATAREIALDHLAEFPDYYDRLARAEQVNEDELFEVRMSTANLRQLAAQTGAMAGMEFEMIVPNVEGEELDPEYERDESYDRRARSFNDVEEFFYDGDYNGRGDIRRLMERINEAYEEWKMERVGDDWMDEGIDYLRDYIANNDLFDREEAIDAARDEVFDANPDLPPESEDFQQLLRTRLDEMEEQFVQDEYEKGRNGDSRIYDDAFEEFVQEKAADYEESDFLEETTPYMSDVESTYDISWPYFYDINADQSGEISVDQVADDFSEAIGRPVNASRSYHGGRREAGTYVVEPDGSLEGDTPGDGGLEFVSPPLPIDEMISDLNKVKKWAGDYGCYTNDSTGLHINISVPNYSLEKLDYVKLALLMGDEYVLDLFGRSGNTYAKAATGKIRDALRKDPSLAPAMMDKMRGHMEDLATKAIHSGITDKYTSINTKTGYIEFRSPGGDWLDANFDKIENTLLRFTVALSAAINPEAYRKEYLKKLYKLLEGAQDRGGVDVIDLFANYSAGELDKAALIRQVREKQLARGVAKGRVTGPMWWRVTNPANTSASIEVVANNAEEAITSAILPGNYPDWARVQNTLRATPVRPYTAPKAKSAASPGQGTWGIWIGASQRFAREPGEHPAGQEIPLRRFPSQEAAEQFLAQTREQHPRMRTDVEVREIPADYQVPPPAGRVYNPNQAQQQAAAVQGSEYELYRRADGRAVTAPAGNAIVFRAINPDDAASKIARYVADFNLPGTADDYDVRSVLQPAQQSNDNWSQDFERRMQQPAQPQQQTFTGYWDVKMGDEVVFRVQAETQGEANNKAREWILGRSSEFLHDHEGQEVSVVPRYA